MVFPVRRIAAVLLAAGLLGACLAAVPAEASEPAAGRGADTSARFLIETGGSIPSRSTFAAALGSDARVDSVQEIGPSVALLTTAGAVALSTVQQALSTVPAVRTVTMDRRIAATGAASPVRVTDDDYADQWGLWDATSDRRAGGYGIDAARAWPTTLGSADVVVAVLDTGITAHPDFVGMHTVPGWDFVSNDPDDGVLSRDGDGWDADPSDPGDWCDSAASSWHGTFVTGEIAAQQNGYGVVGAAPGVSVEPVRVLGACGGFEADEIAAITWASGGTVTGSGANATPDVNAHPANILNMSLESADVDCDAPLQSAIDAAVARGTIVVAAAGNDSSPVDTSAPADCQNVIRVAATTKQGALASYSNYGTSSMPITISAPGGGEGAPIVGDTWSGSKGIAAADNAASIGGYEGTSMATPLVSAAIALLLSTDPALTPAEVESRLVATATPFPASANCTVDRCGTGIVNAGNLVGAALRMLVTTSPSVRGVRRVGAKLTAAHGTWLPGTAAYSYTWSRNGRVIAGAHTATYRLTAVDRGKRIAVTVTARHSGYDSMSRTSAKTAAIAPRKK